MWGGLVPWSAETIVGQRLEFCKFAQGDDVNFTELCERYGIRTKTGYKWLNRFERDGVDGLVDQSRRPHHSPTRTPPAMEELVCDVRRNHPWGGRKIGRHLEDQGHVRVPASSTITDILRRHGLLGPVADHHSGYGSFEAENPNDLWQMDFKGDFDTIRDGRCHPFDILDDHSRYSLCLNACENEQTGTVKGLLIATFDRYGIPLRILCDNGPPWGSPHPGGRDSVLSVWLIDQGIEVSHSRPHHPQTLGKDERFHRTLKLEVLSRRPHWETHTQVQDAFDRWRPIYNHQRPHDSLNGDTPSTRYQPSPRSRPTRIEPPTYPDHYDIRIVGGDARIWFQGRRYKVGRPYRGRPVGITPTNTDGTYHVYYRHQHIRTINLKQ